MGGVQGRALLALDAVQCTAALAAGQWPIKPRMAPIYLMGNATNPPLPPIMD